MIRRTAFAAGLAGALLSLLGGCDAVTGIGTAAEMQRAVDENLAVGDPPHRIEAFLRSQSDWSYEYTDVLKRWTVTIPARQNDWRYVSMRLHVDDRGHFTSMDIDIEPSLL